MTIFNWLIHPDWGWLLVGVVLGYPVLVGGVMAVYIALDLLEKLDRYGWKGCWEKLRGRARTPH